MSTLYHIINDPLPLNQDFNALKEEGLAYIQQVSGNEWTNLNASDPGITILDQVCYALTELGYCNSFPIKDILTREDEKLQVKDQFYLPDKILTVSPITITDYRKYLIDGVDNIDNVIILSEINTTTFSNGIYNVYLLVSPSVAKDEINNICKESFYYLNKGRNLGELFLMPKLLISKTSLLKGTLTITNKANANKILSAINEAIRNYIFPTALQLSYNQLKSDGVETNDIFNGPKLKNGWIQTKDVGIKKDQLRIIDVIRVIESISGIISVSNLKFIADTQSLDSISCNLNEIIEIDVLSSVTNKILNIQYDGNDAILFSENLAPTLQLIQSQKPDAQVVLGSAGNNLLDIPVGKNRDINSYYSIQNTFPEIFAVGADSVTVNASDFQVAQSRQLKGYLTLFDQVLANQFSQLANIDRLFSFKNTLTGNPLNEKDFFSKKDSFEKHNLEYPVPFMSFSSTYFYQSLYNIPHIKPLLKDTDAFMYSDDFLSEKELEQKSWVEYQNNPYNSYMNGLFYFMEDEQVNLQRRNDILNHLLARHGESPLMIDAIILGSIYTGESLKDKVIFKSLYLQNLGLLSYYKQKAYNFIGAKKIPHVIPKENASSNLKIIDDDSVDFIFNSSKINQVEHLSESDFINYSALELKLSMLFGLKILYRDFMANYKKEEYFPKLRLALWITKERRGVIAIETALLRQYSLFAKDDVDHNNNLNPIPILDNGIELIFPSFVPSINNSDFKNRLDLFMEGSCPIHVPYKAHFVDENILEKLIPAYVNWHNCLIFQGQDNLHCSMLPYFSGVLMDVLTEINSVI